MRVKTYVSVLAVLAALAWVPASASTATSAAPTPDARSTGTEIGLWDSDFGAQMTAADCGRWTLDDQGFCTADDVRNGVELGTKFQTSRALAVTGVRVYRVDPGQVTGTLWDADGTRLATGRFAPQTTAGWQDLVFDEPVTIRPGRTYIASYYSPATRYAFRYGFFDDELTRGPVTALRSVAGDPNGVHCYDVATCQYPSRAFRSSTYWVTPLWSVPQGQPVPPPAVPAPPADVDGPSVRVTVPTQGNKRVRTRQRIRITFSEPVRAALLTKATVRLVRVGHKRPVPARLRYDVGRHRLSLTPRSRLLPRTTYRVVVSTAVADLAGNRLDQDPTRPGLQRATWTFRTR
ncbi:DUF4082 domain-containing protein [Nocardioides hwasunensis]|uniref:DUF4082 domain-containing protein n=1 Tax=Nocardioides hwasunensis TaxID=397258 RepID=A0ABR8MIU8_9ACTN|nr:DUF4082 domain-containing protein [Nocardioides hwasunensis]MBD3915505.1 DUF4082 domain-containing protein [Nocardioides hwasunensis]